jgi:hypothetical protein
VCVYVCVLCACLWFVLCKRVCGQCGLCLCPPSAFYWICFITHNFSYHFVTSVSVCVFICVYLCEPLYVLKHVCVFMRVSHCVC